MTAPNLKSLTSVYADSQHGFPTTTEAVLIDTVPVGHTYVVSAIQVTNVTAATSAGITIKHVGGEGSPTSTAHLAYKRTVSGKTSVNVLLGKELYMEEGDQLKMIATVDSTLEVVASYSDMTDL